MLEAIKKKDYEGIIKYGLELIKEGNLDEKIIINIISAYYRLGRLNDLFQMGRKVIDRFLKEKRYEEAEKIVKKLLEYQPMDIRILGLAVKVYAEKGEFDKAFLLLEEKIGIIPIVRLLPLFEKLADLSGRAYYYEKLAEKYLLAGDKNKAYNTFILASEMYDSEGNSERALNALFRAKDVKNTTEINKRIVNFIVLHSRDIVKIIDLLRERRDPDFWLYIFEIFKKEDKIDLLQSIINREDDPLVKEFFTFLTLLVYKNVYSEDLLEDIKRKDIEFYNVLSGYAQKYHTNAERKKLELEERNALLNQVFEKALESIEDIFK
ncbi:hypothetical protein [Desulfurobacterium sp.]|uniref:tetratricopeptide repeat protein n=1 Tax=Desulfurobacterium sp. TaxID=2004706 RepID=UPI002610CB3B|nr:hypothetical protein [Desulfurobacterium sp.]